MNRAWLSFLVGALFIVPLLLYVAEEGLFSQIIFLTQILVLWLLLPFFLRNKTVVLDEWSNRSLLVTILISALSIVPFFIHLTDRSALHTTNILRGSLRIFSQVSEALIVLGICLATIFVISMLIKRRGQEP